MLSIRRGDFADPRVIALLRHHFETNRAVTPAGSAHVLDLSAMQVPAISFWTIWEEDERGSEALLGMGALKALGDGTGEVKSMRTTDAAQRKGVASAMLHHILAAARADGLSTVFLETGSFAYFAPARALYAQAGFVECAPFAGYGPDPNSTFMRLDLA